MVVLGAYDLRRRERSRQAFSISSISENGYDPQENMNDLLLLQVGATGEEGAGERGALRNSGDPGRGKRLTEGLGVETGGSGAGLGLLGVPGWRTQAGNSEETEGLSWTRGFGRYWGSWCSGRVGVARELGGGSWESRGLYLILVVSGSTEGLWGSGRDLGLE